MTKRKTILIVAIAVLMVGGLVLRFWPSAPASVAQAQKAASSASQTPATSSWPNVIPSNEYPQLSLKTMSRDEATKVSVARLMKDHEADWKIPINFYGKVVDENNQPIAEAKVKYDWNTIGVPGGTAFAETSSDGNGLFSLTGQRGKILGVNVEKEGYYSADENLSFEYANPSSPYWYEPDSANPVIFHLRTKGLHATSLLHWKRDVALNAQNQKALDLKTGSTTQGQSSSLVIEVLENSSKMGAFAWSANVSVVGGGLQTYTDRFPFVAPTAGYQPSVEVDMETPKPPVWQGYQGAAFYVQTPDGYGRYEVKMFLGQHSVEVEGYFNPTPGSQDLEPASK